MSKWVLAALFLASTSVFAENTLFSETQSLYEAAAVPNSQTLHAESIWGGKCVGVREEETGSNERSDSAILFHVDQDPVLGSRFFMIPVFHVGDSPSNEEIQEQALRRLNHDDINSVVILDSLENAWRTEAGSQDKRFTYFLRQGTTQAGATAFFLRVALNAETVSYCYYYQGAFSGLNAGGTVVPPPPQ